MRTLFTLPFLLFPTLIGCYQSGNVLTQDAGVRSDAPMQDAGRDAQPTMPIGDPLRCEAAPLLPIDARVESIDPSEALSPPEGSCWDPDPERTVLYYRLEVPPHTGVEVQATGLNAPTISFTEGCLAGTSRCVFYQDTSGGGSDATSRWYYGNPSDSAQSLIINLHWYPRSLPRSTFSLETKSYPLPTEATCETPIALAPDTLLPASTARGGTYENWDCIRSPEAHFVAITVPPRSQAIALEGSQPLQQRSECGCTPGLPFVNQLNNFTDVPTTVLLERNPTEPIGVRYAALPANASCEDATLLEVAENEASARATPLSSYAARISETRADSCATYHEAIWYRVTIPAGRRLRVRAVINTSYPSLAALLGPCGSALGTERCESAMRGDSDSTLELTNPGATAIERTLVVGDDGKGGLAITGSISAFFVE